MDKLPKGWNVNKLLHYCSRITDGSHHSPKSVENGLPYVTVKDVSNSGDIDLVNCKKISKEDFQTLVKSNCQPNIGDVLLSKDGTVGKTAIVYENNFVLLSSLAILSPNANLDSKFLFHFLNSPRFQDTAVKAKTGAAIKRIVLKTIKEFKIPVPPLPEQKRIVTKLDALFERIDKSIALLEENIKQTELLMASVLDEVFGGKNWQFEKLENITSKIGSGSTPKGGQKAYKTEGISLIRSMNVHDGVFTSKGLAFIDDNQAEKLSNVEIEKDDVLFNITGASVARCCVVDNSILPARVNQHVSIIRPKKMLNPFFLQLFLVSPKTKSTLLFSSSGGATREAITKTMINNFEVPVPPISEQEQIVKKYINLKEKIDLIKKEQNDKLSNLKSLKESILDKAFKGEL